MKLSDIYRIAVDAGIEADGRDREEIDRVLAVNKKAYDKLDEADREFFDTEKLSNPYSDTRICAGDPDREIRGMLVGIDMEIGGGPARGPAPRLGVAHRPHPGAPPGGPGLREPARGHVPAGRPLAPAGDRPRPCRQPDRAACRGDPATHHAREPLPRHPGGGAARFRVHVVPHPRGQLGARVRPAVPRRALSRHAGRCREGAARDPRVRRRCAEGIRSHRSCRGPARRGREGWSPT